MKGTLSLILIAAALLGTVATPLADDRAPAGCSSYARPAAADAWPGWRGAAHGKASGPLPIHWSADQYIRWKTPIPGRGHSSPIVYGDQVYVTTAEVMVGGVLLDRALRLLTIGLVLVVASLALRLAADLCGREPAPTSRSLAAATILLAVASVLAVTACCGDGLFDLARSPVRGWIASIAFVSLCLSLAAATVDRARIRSLIGLSAFALAIRRARLRTG